MAKLYLRNFIFIIASLLAVTACTSSFKTIYIETAKPSESILSNDILSLTLMNRSVTDEFKNYDEDSVQLYFYKKQFDVTNILIDSVAADTTLKVLGELLFESGRYDVVIPKNLNIYRGTKFYKIPNQLEWKFVKNICELYDTDALLVIERYVNKIATDYKVTSDMYMEQYIHEASIDSKYDAVIKIYNPEKEEITRQFVVSDTIYWYYDDISQKKLFAKLPSIKEALIQTGIQLAFDIDKKLSPSWITEQRGYFSINHKADTAVVNSIDQGNYESAYKYWLNYSNSRNKSIKSKAEFNLALASEMQGNIEKAIEWANKSYKTQYRTQTDQYLRKLGKRRQNLKKFKELTD